MAAHYYLVEKFPQRTVRGHKWGLFSTTKGGNGKTYLGGQYTRKGAVLTARLLGGRSATITVIK